MDIHGCRHHCAFITRGREHKLSQQNTVPFRRMLSPVFGTLSMFRLFAHLSRPFKLEYLPNRRILGIEPELFLNNFRSTRRGSIGAERDAKTLQTRGRASCLTLHLHVWR